MIEITPIARASGVKYAVPSGRIGRRIRMIPYVANLSTSPARIMDPATGASTCARTSHRWNGSRGVLMANERNTPSHRTFCRSADRSAVIRASKSVLPTV